MLKTMWQANRCITLLLLGYSIICYSQGAKILMFPFPYFSHIKELTHIGEELVKNGHELHIILPPSLPQIQKFRDDKTFTLIEYKMKYKDFHQVFGDESGEEMDNILEDIIDMAPTEDFRVNTKGYLELCQNPLEDTNLYERVKRENYDLAMMDAFPITRCYYILMYKLAIPYVSMTTQYEPWLFRTPALPSFVPFGLHGKRYSDRMNFWERLSNTFALIDWTARTTDISYLDNELVRKYAPDMPFVSINWLAGRSLFWLFDTDIAIDYPRPTMPNEINIGGLSTKPAKPLPKDIQMFMDDAPDGVILASFGSFSAIPKKYMKIILEAFKLVKQKVIFRYIHNHPEKIPKHVKLLKWIPQNDILGHPNIKLFITHCGANSQFEGLYHAVPMLNFPVFGDQPYNAKRADHKGYSRTMLFSNMTIDSIMSNINAIISNSSYYENIKKGSLIFKDSPMIPQMRAVYWIEHILKHGGKYLHSYALDMPWYEYLMIDIVVFFLAILIVPCMILYCVISMLCKRCFGGVPKKVKTN